MRTPPFFLVNSVKSLRLDDATTPRGLLREHQRQPGLCRVPGALGRSASAHGSSEPRDGATRDTRRDECGRDGASVVRPQPGVKDWFFRRVTGGCEEGGEGVAGKKKGPVGGVGHGLLMWVMGRCDSLTVVGWLERGATASGFRLAKL